MDDNTQTPAEEGTVEEATTPATEATEATEAAPATEEATPAE